MGSDTKIDPAEDLGGSEDLEGLENGVEGDAAAVLGAQDLEAAGLEPGAPNKKSSGHATAETLANQGKSPAEGTSGAPAKAGSPAVQTVADTTQFLHQRSANVAAILKDKEGLQLAFVRYKWPRPYYVRWKHEANDLFVLAVTLKRRRQSLTKPKVKAG